MAASSVGPRKDVLARLGRTPVEVPEEMTVAETTEWVAEDVAKAESALIVEKAKPKPRRGVVDSLEPIVDGE